MTIYQCSQIMTANLDKDPSSCECQLNSTIQRTSRGIEKRKGKPIEVEGVEEWEVERILNKRK